MLDLNLNLNSVRVLHRFSRHCIRLRHSLPHIHASKKTVVAIYSIDTFEKTTERSDNDKNNSVREHVIEFIVNQRIPDTYYQYSKRWMRLRTRLYDFIGSSLGINAFNHVECITKAGRKYNYDFEFVFDHTTTRKIEFKFNCNKVSSCPQFLSLSSKSFGQYAEFVYDSGVINEMSMRYGVPAIDRKSYIKHVHQTSYEKNKWFLSMYTNEEQHKAWKKTIIDRTIDAYLESFMDSVSLASLESKMKQTQSDKIFMCYCPVTRQFYRDSISDEELSITKKRLKHCGTTGFRNTIVLDTQCATTKIHLLLRWRNHAGILNPAWQISLHRHQAR
jgi:hypothetical protein